MIFLPPLTLSIDIGTLACNKIADISVCSYNRVNNWIRKKEAPKKDWNRREVTVIINAHKREKTIEKSIREMFNQDYPIKNMYISDSQGLDNTKEVVEKLKAEFPNLHYWSKEGITSKSEKINYLARDPNVELAELVYLKDSSAKPHPKLLEELVKGFSKPNIGAVTSFGFVTPPKNYPATYFHYGKEWVNKMGQFRKSAQQLRRAMYVMCGASFMVKSDLLKTIEIPTGTQTEDTAYTWKLQEKGHKVGVAQDAIVSAEDVNSLKSQILQTYRWYTGSWQNLSLNLKELFLKRKGASLGYTTIIPGFIESVLYCGTLLSLPVIYNFSPKFAEGFVTADTALTLLAPAIAMTLVGKWREIPSEMYNTVRHIHQITAYKALASGILFYSGAKTLADIVSGKSKKWNGSWKKVY